MAEPTATPTPPPGPGSPFGVAELTDRLEREIEATADRPRKAQLLYELGELLEIRAQDEARAVRSYVAAVNADPSLRLPLWNLYRIFTTRRSFKNLAKIVDAEVRASPEGVERAVALTTRAELSEDRLDDAAGAREIFAQARGQDPRCQSALIALERHHAAERAIAELASVIAGLGEAREHPVLRALHAAELAELQDALPDADPERTAGLWREASRSTVARWRILQGAERFAARADRPEDLAEVLEAQADMAASQARGEAVDATDPLPFVGAEGSTAAAIGLYRRAARIREVVCKDAATALATIERALPLSPADALLRADRLRLAEKIGDAERITRCIDEALEHAAPEAKASVLLRAAEDARRRRDAAGERAYLLRAIGESPGSSAATALYEAHLLSQRDTEGLVQRLTTLATEATEPSQRTRFWLGAADAALGWAGSAERADELFARALEAAPADPTILRARAALQRRLGAWSALAATLEALLGASSQTDEKLSLARELASVRAYRLRDGALGIETCQRALSVDPECRWALWMLTDLGAEAGRHDVRAEAHEKLAALAASAPEATAQLTAAAHARSLGGDHVAALSALRQAAERSPDDTLVLAMIDERLRVADAWVELIAQARQRAQSLVDKGPEEIDNVLRLLGRAAVHAENRSRDAALTAELYQQIIEVAPEDDGGWYGLTRALTATGDAGKLVQALQARAEKLTGSPRALALLEIAERHEVAGRPDLADEAYRGAIEADGGLVDALPGRIATVGATGSRTALQELLQSARASASATFARALDEELLLLDGGELGGAADRLDRDDGAPALALLYKAWRAGDRGDVTGRLAALARFAQVTATGPLHVPVLGLLAGAARAAFSDDVLQSTARSLVTADPGARSLGVTAADGMRSGLDASLRASALSARLALVSPARRTEVEIERGEALEQAGQDDSALAAYRTVLEVYPDDLTALEGVRRTTRRLGSFAELADASEHQARLLAEPFGAAPMWEEAGLLAEDQLSDRKRAEACYRAALEGDMGRSAAYERLHAILLARGAKRELATYVRRRSEVVMDPELLTSLFWEHAELLRTLGDREGALAALENLLLLADDHLPGLSMRATLLTELKRVAEAVEALGALADAEPDVREKRAARLRAAELLEKGERDHEGALAQLWKLDEDGFADLDTYEWIADVAARAGLDDALLRAQARLAAVRPDVSGRVAAERTAANTLRKRGDLAGAADALSRLLALQPDEMTALDELCEIHVDPADRATALDSAERTLREKFERDPLDATTLHALATVFSLGGQKDARFLACSLLEAMGAATAAEAHDATSLRELLPARPAAALSPTTLERLVHPDDRGAAQALFQTIADGLPEHYGLQPSAFGVGKSARIGAKGVSPLRDEVAIWTGALSLGPIELYQGGPEASAVVPLPGPPPVLILGAELRVPLGPAELFVLGRAAMRLRRGTAALHGRDADEIGALLFAAVRSALPNAPAPPLLRLAEFTQSLPSALGRKIRKILAEPAQAFASGPDWVEWVLAERHTANRVGALLARDPARALPVIATRSDVASMRRAPEAVELVRFVLSPLFLSLRREAGLGIR